MPTYSEIQNYVKARHGFVPKTCWIADVKELNGLATRISPNRVDPVFRVHPCPPDKRDAMTGLGLLQAVEDN